MMVVISRKLTPPGKSFFLLGPRGTGKSTFLRATYPDARWFNLLRNSELLRLMQDPDLFRKEVEALQPGSWVVVDEIQRYPALLNEVHDLLSTRRKGQGQYKFVLTGSSARKLKRSGVNLMAGRAVQRRMFPFVSAEVGNFKLDVALQFGMLPDCWLSENDLERVDFLESYLDTYLREEIKEEALVRKLEPFSRFLKVAAITNGQQSNLGGIARDAGVSRPTVQGYFDVLVDTLIGFWLPAWRPKAKIKETVHPKFYFFDAGVVRALAGRLRAPLSEAETGSQLETVIVNEIRAYLSYAQLGGALSFWRTPHRTEIDLIYENPRDSKGNVGFEIKSSARWKSEYASAMHDLIKQGTLAQGHGIYLGEHALKDGAVQVHSVSEFLKKLWAGEIL